MRKSLWIMLAALVVAIGAPRAHADSVYAISFSGDASVVGSNLLDYNSTSMEFTTPSLEVMFDGFTITLATTSTSGVSPNDPFTWAIGGGGCDCFAAITDVSPFVFFPIYLGSVPQAVGFNGGSVTFTAVTAPEPSSIALMLLGVGLVFVMRKRIGHGLPQAS